MDPGRAGPDQRRNLLHRRGNPARWNHPKTVDIWSVPVGNRIFIRSYNGTQGKWYGPALETGRGRISAGGLNKNVTFVPVAADDEETNQAVDASFRRKYADSEYAVTMSTEPVSHNTIEVIPDELI